MTVLGCDGCGGGYSCVQKDQETLIFFRSEDIRILR